MLGNCPFSPQLQGRKMEYELLELSFVSFSYCCVIFNVIDAGVSGHIFFPGDCFQHSSNKLFNYDSFLPLRNIFRSILCQTYPAMSFILSMITYLQSFHHWPIRTLIRRYVLQCGSELKSFVRPLQNEDVLDCTVRYECIDQPVLERWGNFLGSVLRSGADSRILVLSQCKWRVEREGGVAFGNAGKQTVK